MKKLLKALAIFLGSFDFSSFTGKVGTCSHECTLSFLFLHNVPHYHYFVIRFCYKSTAVLLLSFFFFITFTMGDKEDKLFYCYPQIYYQWHYFSHFEFLLLNLLCVTDYMLLIMRLVVFISWFQ